MNTYTTTVTNLYTIPNPTGYVVNAIFEVTGASNFVRIVGSYQV